MRRWIFLSIALIVVFLSGKTDGRKKKGCKLNGRVYAKGETAVKEESQCVEYVCTREKKAEGGAVRRRRPYHFKQQTPEGCQCFSTCHRCQDYYDPVCGSNGVTYTSSCHLWTDSMPCGKTDAELVYYGECGECPTECPNERRPVCGSDKVTYDNECQLLQAGCRGDTVISKVHDGPCKGRRCKFNGRKYRIGWTIEKLPKNCLRLTCQMVPGSKKPQVTLVKYGDDFACSCTSPTSDHFDEYYPL